MRELADLFAEQLQVKRRNKLTLFVNCRMSEGSSVSAHMRKMMSYVEQLKRLDAPLSREQVMDFVLGSLPYNFSNFVTHNHENWDGEVVVRTSWPSQIGGGGHREGGAFQCSLQI